MTNARISIGKYRIVEEIVSSAAGSVYRCEDPSTSASNRIVAVKLLQTPYLDFSQAYGGLFQEVQLLKKLQHPHILSILDEGIDKDLAYLVLEYAPNGSLYDRLKQQDSRPLPLQEALTILTHIGKALHYAHDQGVIHGDLEPANILFNTRGEALLADFAIATVNDSRIKRGIEVGVPFYMAPEQFGGSISKEGDQYALACIAYELLTGRVPFTAPDFFALRVKHLRETPIPPTQLNLLVPRSLERAIFKAMAKQKTERYADVAAFVAALDVPPTTLRFMYPTPQVPTPSPLQALPPIAIRYTTTMLEESKKPLDVSLHETVPLPSTPLPASMQWEREEETGKNPSVGKLDPPFNVSGLLNREEEGTSLALASALPQKRQGVHHATGISSSATKWLSHQKTRSRRRTWLIVAMISLLLLLLSGSVLYAMSSMFKPKSSVAFSGLSATVTITPLSLNGIYPISAVTGTPLASQQQVSARLLSITTPEQSQTVQATGIGTIPATHATGPIHFTNTTTQVQTLRPGSVFTGSDGIQVMLTQEVQIPAGSPYHPLKYAYNNGSAYAINSGAGGNIPVRDINKVLYSVKINGHLEEIRVLNKVAFTGGKDTQHDTVVQQSDVNNATSNAKALEPSLTHDAQSRLQKQTRSNEVPVGPAHCSPTTHTDHVAGDAALTVTTTIKMTCSYEVYDQVAAYAIARNLLIQTFGPTQPFGNITTSVIQANVVDSKGTLSLLVKATSPLYQFTDAQMQQFASLIAGKNESDARTLLMNQAGISQVTITVSGGNGQTLPTDPKQITIIVSS